MSSSRSIAAARNRRAGDSSSSSSQQQQQSRPNTSIGSSAVFSQQQSGGMKNVRQQAPPPPQLQRSQGQRASQIQSTQPAIPARPKISVSDAIGLTTLRLGKVEQFIMDFMEAGGMETIGAGVGGIPENTKLVDNSVLTSIINRLDALEKKEMAMIETIAKLEKANTELASKLDASILDTNGRISDIDAAFADLEAKVFEGEGDGEGEGEGEKQDNVEADTLAGEDLKNMVQQELQGE
jgi:hypothetical protein